MEYAEENELDNVSFYPMQPSGYAPHIYSMADINIIPLAEGIIKTALPSKTAFCLSCGKPIIACLDMDSKFSRMLRACEKCHVVGSNDAQGLANGILRNFEEGIKGRSSGERELFKTTFSREMNASEYIRLIVEIACADQEMAGACHKKYL
jgi:glycosyltransferase involved in cell wall biosynthesis